MSEDQNEDAAKAAAEAEELARVEAENKAKEDAEKAAKKEAAAKKKAEKAALAEEEKANKPNKDGFLPGQYVNPAEFDLHRAKVSRATATEARKEKPRK